MPTYRCEFSVAADLVLPSDVAALVLETDAGLKSTIRNAPVDEEGHATGLLVTVIGAAQSIDQAEKELRRGLAGQLDLLAFTTHSRFKIAAPLRLFEWEPGAGTRHFRIFHTQDAREPPAPELEAKFLETAAALDHGKPPAFARTALRYFRYGLIDTVPEDQFMRLWLALEVLAENMKEKIRVPINCGVCGAPVKCVACGDEPTRVPMAKQAIGQLIANVCGEKDAPRVAKRQFAARNGLMHGKSPEAIEADCQMPLDGIVDELGALTWRAIMSTLHFGEEKPYAFGHRDGEFTNKTLTLAMRGSFEHRGDEPHPTDNALPNAEVSLITRFGKRSLTG